MLPPVQAQQIRTTIEIRSAFDAELAQQARSSIEGALADFHEAYVSKNTPDLSSDRYTETARVAILELWSRSPFRCIYTIIEGPLLRRSIDGLYEFRGVTLHLEDEAGDVFNEEGLFLLNQDGQIEDFKFGLDIHRYAQILESRKDVTDFRNRQFILDFVDNFRTSYNRKDLTFLKNVFSENALIIVGRIVQERENNELTNRIIQGLGSERVEFIQHSKNEYLDRLNEIFERNEYIKVEFDSLKVYSHAEIDGIYGVQLYQHWHSYSTRQAGYSDEGYLFLMIDLRKTDAPTIHVRTWQPGTFTSPDDAISLGNFKIIG